MTNLTKNIGYWDPIELATPTKFPKKKGEKGKCPTPI